MTPLHTDTISQIGLSQAAHGAAMRASRSAAPADELMQVAKGFESILLGQLMGEMKSTIPASGMFDTAASRQVNDLFWFFLAQGVSDQGGMGLWKGIYEQMSDSATDAAAGATLEQQL